MTERPINPESIQARAHKYRLEQARALLKRYGYEEISPFGWFKKDKPNRTKRRKTQGL
jgi:hypothetical protein